MGDLPSDASGKVRRMKTVAEAKISRVVLAISVGSMDCCCCGLINLFCFFHLMKNFPSFSASLGKLIKLESFAEKIVSRGLSFREKQKV